MRNRQLQVLFICNLLVFSTSNGLLPLLPVYAVDLGATPTLVGGLMAFAYTTLTIGTLMTKTLIRRFRNPKRLFVAMSLLCVILTIMLGMVATIWQLAVVMAMLWFCGGIVVALIAVFTGVSTDKTNRGKVFGFMYLALPLGALLGGATIGRLVDWQGYAFMFALLGVTWLCVAVLGWVGIRNVKETETTPAQMTNPASLRPEAVFYFLLGAVFLSAVTVFVGRLGISLSMQSLSFTAGAITGISAIGALAVIPIVPLLGSLSDRVGRYRFLSLCYGLGAAGVLILGLSTQAWHFGVAAACLSISTYAGSAIASALATDLLPPEALNWGLPRLSAMTWIGGIFGFAGTGYLIDTLGSTSTYWSAAVLSVIAIVLLQSHHWYRLWLVARRSPPTT
jgi:MFS transporter, DHA1 family, multidrug resistance protein